MSTAKFNQWLNPDGTENYKCRAWVNFNGTGTVAIRASGNVSSITDNALGDYTVNFTTAMADANFAVANSAQGTNTNDGYSSTTSVSTTSVRVVSRIYNALQDSALACVAIFR